MKGTPAAPFFLYIKHKTRRSGGCGIPYSSGDAPFGGVGNLVWN
jgi:hypothetical protein